MTSDPQHPRRITREDVMTAEDVADLLHVKPRTVYRWAATGAIPSVKAGRRVLLLHSDVDAWIMRNRRGRDAR